MSYVDNMILTAHNAEEVKAKAANGKPFKVDVTTNIGSARELSSKDEPGTLFFPYDANGTIIFNGDEMRAITKKDMTEGPFTIDDNGSLQIKLNTPDIVFDGTTLIKDDGVLSVNYDKSLTISKDNKLSVNIGSGVKLDEDGGLTVKTGDGVKLNKNGKITVNVGNGLKFTRNPTLGTTITLNVSTGLAFGDDGELFVTDTGDSGSNNSPVFKDLGNLTKLATGSVVPWVGDIEVKKGLHNILSQGNTTIDDGIYSFNYGYKIGSNAEVTKVNNCVMMAFSTGNVVSQIIFSNSFADNKDLSSPGIFMRNVIAGDSKSATTDWVKYPDDSSKSLAPTSW